MQTVHQLSLEQLRNKTKSFADVSFVSSTYESSSRESSPVKELNKIPLPRDKTAVQVPQIHASASRDKGPKHPEYMIVNYQDYRKYQIATARLNSRAPRKSRRKDHNDKMITIKPSTIPKNIQKEQALSRPLKGNLGQNKPNNYDENILKLDIGDTQVKFELEQDDLDFLSVTTGSAYHQQHSTVNRRHSASSTITSHQSSTQNVVEPASTTGHPPSQNYPQNTVAESLPLTVLVANHDNMIPHEHDKNTNPQDTQPVASLNVTPHMVMNYMAPVGLLANWWAHSITKGTFNVIK